MPQPGYSSALTSTSRSAPVPTRYSAPTSGTATGYSRWTYFGVMSRSISKIVDVGELSPAAADLVAMSGIGAANPASACSRVSQNEIAIQRPSEVRPADTRCSPDAALIAGTASSANCRTDLSLPGSNCCVVMRMNGTRQTIAPRDCVLVSLC